MAKKVIKKLKMIIPGGKATPAPPVGQTLGQAGINIGDFVNKFNDATKNRMGEPVPVKVSVYEDRTYDFVTKTSPASALLLKIVKKDKGSGKPNVSKIGSVTMADLKEIAKTKLADLNAHDEEEGAKIIAGTARSMGIDVK